MWRPGASNHRLRSPSEASLIFRFTSQREPYLTTCALAYVRSVVRMHTYSYTMQTLTIRWMLSHERTASLISNMPWSFLSSQVLEARNIRISDHMLRANNAC